MGSRGRKSSASLALPQVDGKRPRLDPPTHLGADERRRFLELVESCDPDHFRPSDLPLLCRFVEADVIGELAATELRTGGAVIDGRASPWLIAQEKAVRALVALATKLRLSPSSRTDPKTIARHKPIGRTPWDPR